MNPASSLSPSYCLDSDARNVREKAARLTARLSEQRDKARKLFDYVRDGIRYNFAPQVRERSHFKASHALELGNGFCMQKAALFAALCRAAGIPARIGFQHLVDYKIVGPFFDMLGGNVLENHGMNAIYLDGRWLAVDCTLDRALCERKNYRLVEFDGRRDALLPATDRSGKPHFTIAKQKGFYKDTPQFAMRTFLSWVENMPYDNWRKLVHRQHGSM
ncbi:MAG: transglutaminase domain-containing protein [Acidobacteria bacterium]|nr:transglutaminase domain-containing protein [Acidobacteriota bacterium]